MGYLKQDDVKGNQKRAKNGKRPAAEQQTVPPIIVSVEADAGLGGIEMALDRLAGAVRDYANNAAMGENKFALFTGEEGRGNYPVIIALDPASETTENLLELGGRIPTAFERIADVLRPSAPKAA